MQIIVVGGGKIGAHLASQLCSDNESVTVIEARPDAIERLRRAIHGNSGKKKYQKKSFHSPRTFNKSSVVTPKVSKKSDKEIRRTTFFFCRPATTLTDKATRMR